MNAKAIIAPWIERADINPLEKNMNAIPTALESKEKTAQFVWTGFILLFFIVQAIIWTVAIAFTSNDRSHVVLPDYNQQSLNWDEQRAAGLASEKLGWKLDWKVDSASDILGNRVITLTLRQSDESPVTDASIQLAVFHRARAAERQSISMSQVADGVYSGVVRVRKSGWWQFEGSITKDVDVFLIDHRQEIRVEK